MLSMLKAKTLGTFSTCGSRPVSSPESTPVKYRYRQYFTVKNIGECRYRQRGYQPSAIRNGQPLIVQCCLYRVLCYSSTRSSILSDWEFEYSTITRSGGMSEVVNLTFLCRVHTCMVAAFQFGYLERKIFYVTARNVLMENVKIYCKEISNWIKSIHFAA